MIWGYPYFRKPPYQNPFCPCSLLRLSIPAPNCATWAAGLCEFEVVLQKRVLLSAYVTLLWNTKCNIKKLKKNRRSPWKFKQWYNSLAATLLDKQLPSAFALNAVLFLPFLHRNSMIPHFCASASHVCIHNVTYPLVDERNYGKYQSLVGKTHYEWPFSLAMLVIEVPLGSHDPQRLDHPIACAPASINFRSSEAW